MSRGGVRDRSNRVTRGHRVTGRATRLADDAHSPPATPGGGGRGPGGPGGGRAARDRCSVGHPRRRLRGVPRGTERPGARRHRRLPARQRDVRAVPHAGGARGDPGHLGLRRRFPVLHKHHRHRAPLLAAAARPRHRRVPVDNRPGRPRRAVRPPRRAAHHRPRRRPLVRRRIEGRLQADPRCGHRPRRPRSRHGRAAGRESGRCCENSRRGRGQLARADLRAADRRRQLLDPGGKLPLGGNRRPRAGRRGGVLCPPARVRLGPCRGDDGRGSRGECCQGVAHGECRHLLGTGDGRRQLWHRHRVSIAPLQAAPGHGLPRESLADWESQRGQRQHDGKRPVVVHFQVFVDRQKANGLVRGLRRLGLGDVAFPRHRARVRPRPQRHLCRRAPGLVRELPRGHLGLARHRALQDQRHPKGALERGAHPQRRAELELGRLQQAQVGAPLPRAHPAARGAPARVRPAARHRPRAGPFQAARAAPRGRPLHAARRRRPAIQRGRVARRGVCDAVLRGGQGRERAAGEGGAVHARDGEGSGGGHEARGLPARRYKAGQERDGLPVHQLHRHRLCPRRPNGVLRRPDRDPRRRHPGATGGDQALVRPAWGVQRCRGHPDGRGDEHCDVGDADGDGGEQHRQAELGEGVKSRMGAGRGGFASFCGCSCLSLLLCPSWSLAHPWLASITAHTETSTRPGEMRATAPVHRAMRVVSEFSARGLARGLVFNPGDAKSDDPHHWRLDPQLVQQLSFHPKRETPIANNGTPGTNTATLDGGEVTRPLVLLLGWWGASPGNLKHYRDLYADLGYDTLVHLPPMRHTFLPRSTVRKNWRMLEALDVFRKSRQGPLRIVVHAMSNNGAYNAACLGALMRLRSSPPPGLAPEKEFLYTGRATEIALDRILPSGNGSPPPDLAALRDCIAGIIVDSAPSALTPRVIAKAAAIVFTGAPDITPSVRRFGIAGSTWWDLFERFFAFWMRRPSVVAGMDGLLFPALDRLPSLFPRAEFLMLYGKGDKLVPAESVVEYRDHLRGLGARARALEFEGSGHVAHYRGKNRFAYAKAVGEFLQRCAGHGAEGGAADGAGARRSVVGTDVRGG